MFWDNAVCYYEEDLGGTMVHWCRNAKCLDLQKELDKLAEVIKEVEKLVIPVG
jgi:hypothetical protein